MHENLIKHQRNKFRSQQIRKQFAERQKIRQNKSSNYQKQKIRKNSVIRQSLKQHVKCDHDYYSYNFSDCTCDFNFDDNLCSLCTRSDDVDVTNLADIDREKNVGVEGDNCDDKQSQKFIRYFGFDYLSPEGIKKTNNCNWNLKQDVGNSIHDNHDRLHLLLYGIFRQLVYPTYLHFPNDICNLISKYIFGKSKSKRCQKYMATIHWLATSINNFMNLETNQCEFEHNRCDCNNNNSTHSFNLLQFIYVRGNTIGDMLLSRSSEHINIVLDTYQLTRHFQQHLKLYHSKHSLKQNRQCKCIYWQYYHNNLRAGKIKYSDCYIYSRLKYCKLFSFDRYVRACKYTLNVHFVSRLILNMSSNLTHITSPNLPSHQYSDVCCFQFQSDLIYNGINLKNTKIRFCEGCYNIETQAGLSEAGAELRNPDQYYKLYNEWELGGIKKYVNQYIACQKRRNCNIPGQIAIDVPVYPLKLQMDFNDFTFNSMYIDLNSFVQNCDNGVPSNLKYMIMNWNCNYNFKIYEMNKRGLLDIESKIIRAPNINVINKHTVIIYFWRLVNFCQTLVSNKQLYLWKIDKNYLLQIQKYTNWGQFWNYIPWRKAYHGYGYRSNYGNFFHKILKSNIPHFNEYYPELQQMSRRNNRKRKRKRQRKRKNGNNCKNYCCYFQFKTSHNANIKNRNLYFDKFQALKHIGFDTIFQSKLVDDKSFRQQFVKSINDSYTLPLQQKIELNCCLVEFNYIDCIKNDLKDSNLVYCYYSYQTKEHKKNCKYRYKCSINSIIKYCKDTHRRHARSKRLSIQRDREKKIREQEKIKKEKETERIFSIDSQNYYENELNKLLMDSEYNQCFKINRNKKFGQISQTRINYRKKQNKKHKLFKQTKKVSKRRSYHKRKMDKKKNKESSKEKFNKQYLMSLQDQFQYNL